MLRQGNERVFIKLIESGKYKIDDEGKLWRLKGGKTNRDIKPKLSGRKMPNGYIQVRVSHKGKIYHCYLHRIIWIYYNGDIPKGLQINHIDGDKSNNTLNNLRLATPSQSKKYAVKSIGCWEGVRNGMAKLTKENVLQIRELAITNTTHKDIAESFGMSQSHISDIIHQRSWKHIQPVQWDKIPEPKSNRPFHKRIYHMWYAMIDRCTNPKLKSYKRYGGRGITVCDEWQKSLDTFYLFAINNNFSIGLEIDRIDNDDGYHPNNVRFVSRKINSRNKKNNTLITINGETKTLVEWAEISGVGRATIGWRYKNGYSEEALLQNTKIRKEL